jgi:hypothetical protein
MIGMNALMIWNMLLGRFQSSTDCFQTVPKMMKLVCANSFLNMLCTYTVRTLYERCTYNVHTLYVQNMGKVHTVYTSQYRIMHFVHTPYVLLTFDIDQYVLVHLQV